eukprot:CAMPEP_0195075404 /NCGR_PEP_ID=MMETSP0448-20130528/18286_1 /TAXON_ID=66468 /ORGANISM="Heterocapsa triquestra, Strain CCMP 448" /LENGTH=152 /DNA_ID=CAMNT_0040107787 /DNA_START=625 /DNA_END=1083 /DNA_ORIENTATION=+
MTACQWISGYLATGLPALSKHRRGSLHEGTGEDHHECFGFLGFRRCWGRLMREVHVLSLVTPGGPGLGRPNPAALLGPVGGWSVDDMLGFKLRGAITPGGNKRREETTGFLLTGGLAGAFQRVQFRQCVSKHALSLHHRVLESQIPKQPQKA